jgi:hypothetical protein
MAADNPVISSNLNFEQFLQQISDGATFSASYDLVSFLNPDSREERVIYNRRLAEIYLKLEKPTEAKVFAERAWLISDFSNEILPLYIEVHEVLKDYLCIRDGYKRIGIREANRGNVQEAIYYFNLWQYTFAKYEKTDKYAYDFDIFDAVKRLSIPFQFSSNRTVKPVNDKIRIAHIVYSLAPALHKIDHAIAEFIDKSRFETVFVIPATIMSDEVHKKFIDHLEKFNCTVITSDEKNDLSRALDIAAKINSFKPDIIFNSASIADFWSYFIALLFPGKINVASLTGPPPLYVSPIHDCAITPGQHLKIDCLTDCKFVNMELPMPVKEDHLFLGRKSFQIPDDSIVIVSGGRASKFQHPLYWKAVVEILLEQSNAYLIVVGVLKHELLFLHSLVSQEIESRMIFLQSRADYLSIYAMADFAIDTFPQSGGIMIMEIMALGLPIVSFENDFTKLYDQVNNSLAWEYCSIPELIVNRYNFNEFKTVSLNLMQDKAFRVKMALKCKEKAHANHGNSQRMVKRYEEIFMELIKKKLQNHGTIKCKNKTQQEPDLFKDLKFKKLLQYFMRIIWIRILRKFQ